jgi:hypothetical protein
MQKIKKLSIKLQICNKITNNFGIMSHLDEQNSQTLQVNNQDAKEKKIKRTKKH